MSESLKILLTASATVLGGVFVFAITEIAKKLLIEPVTQQRQAIGDVDFRLTYWAWAYGNPQEKKTPERDKAMDELREAAGRLLATTNAIRWWPLARWLGAVDSAPANNAASLLIGLSNSVYGTHDHERPRARDASSVRTLLRIPLAGRAYE
jgi:hypothetical protein